MHKSGGFRRTPPIGAPDAVYEQAKQVVIWLGELSSGGRVGMERLKYWSLWTYHTWKQNREHGHPIKRLQSSSIGIQATANALKEQECGEISQLLDRPWWRRIWIVQEVVLAKKAVVHCGPDEVPWDLIRKRIQKLNPFELVEDVDAAPELYSFPQEEHLILHDLQTRWRSGTWNVILYELLYGFQRFQCTDQRDRIYAFLGLASDGHSLDLVPEYTLPTSEIFMRLARAFVIAHKNLLILNCKRESHKDNLVDQQTKVYSMVDQARFHDTEANLIDGPDHKPRKRWSRLPDGWERMVENGTAYFYNHSTQSRHDTSPLVHKIGLPPQGIAAQRRLPPGWVKIFDNLG